MNKIEKLIEELCPEGVEYRRLGDCLDYEQPGNYIVVSKDYLESGIPVLTAGQTFILGYTDEINGVYKASKDNPVIIFDDFTTSFHWVTFDFKVKSSAMKMLKPKTKDVVFRFVYHLMKCIKYETLEHSRQWISKYSKIEIPIPPISIQEKIVEILDKFTALEAELEKELEAELEARRKQYEHYREKLLDLEGKEGVEMKKIGDLFIFKNGLNKEKQYFGQGTPIVNYTDVYHNKSLKREQIKGRVTLTESETDRFKAHRGDVFFTRTSETPEEVGFASVLLDEIENCTYSGFLLRARPITNLLLPEFCAYCFSTHKVRREIVKNSTFTTRALTNGPSLSKISIPIPPLSEQRRIVSILDRFEALTNDLQAGLPAEIAARRQQYEYYREKLLTFKRKTI